MPKDDPQVAGRHRRTRHDHAAETAEDYAQAVYDLCTTSGRCRVVDLAKRFGVSHVTVTKVVRRLHRDGIVDTEPYGPITLTPHGNELAKHAQRRHQIVYDMLRAIGVAERIAAIDAEGIEHHVSPETLRRFERFLSDRLARRDKNAEGR